MILACVQLQWQAKAAMVTGANVFIVDAEASPCDHRRQPNNKHDHLYNEQHAAQVTFTPPPNAPHPVWKNIYYPALSLPPVNARFPVKA